MLVQSPDCHCFRSVLPNELAEDIFLRDIVCTHEAEVHELYVCPVWMKQAVETS